MWRFVSLTLISGFSFVACSAEPELVAENKILSKCKANIPNSASEGTADRVCRCFLNQFKSQLTAKELDFASKSFVKHADPDDFDRDLNSLIGGERFEDLQMNVRIGCAP